jgi:hypothetical protein
MFTHYYVGISMQMDQSLWKFLASSGIFSRVDGCFISPVLMGSSSVISIFCFSYSSMLEMYAQEPEQKSYS